MKNNLPQLEAAVNEGRAFRCTACGTITYNHLPACCECGKGKPRDTRRELKLESDLDGYDPER